MDRRAQGISLNVIVIAAIALLILVILTALVLNTAGETNRGVNSCEAQGTEGVHWDCVPQGESCDPNWIPNPARNCAENEFTDEPQTCCIPL